MRSSLSTSAPAAPPVDLPIGLHKAWLDRAAGDAVLSTLRTAIAWEQHYVRLFGRSVASPRLSCWMGDAEAVYTYSQTRFQPRAWIDPVLQLRQRLQQFCGAPFNSVLLNWYRGGSDGMGWHSDDEPELGVEPIIASLSLGTTRRFLMRRRHHHPDRHALNLEHGDLLLMFGASQRDWQHALPKAPKVQGDRINLTFRLIHPG